MVIAHALLHIWWLDLLISFLLLVVEPRRWYGSSAGLYYCSLLVQQRTSATLYAICNGSLQHLSHMEWHPISGLGNLLAATEAVGHDERVGRRPPHRG